MPKGKKNKKRFSGGNEEFIDSKAAKKERQRAAFKKNRRFILPLILNTVLFFTVYSILVAQSQLIMTVTFWTYFALTLGFGAAYIIYNRGFSRMNLTPDMLPNSMSYEEKAALIADGKNRIEKSKWMLTVIFPLLMTFILDVFKLFILDPMFELSDATETLASAFSVSFM